MCRIEQIVSALMVALMIGGCASQAIVQKEEFSSFLGDYSQLKPTIDESGSEVLRWQSPKLNADKYSRLMLDPVVFYPALRVSSQVSVATLEQMRRYLNRALIHEVSKVITLAHEPGPGVLRLRTAMTGAAIKTDEMKGYEYMPFTMIVAGASNVTGVSNRETFVILEAELIDSRSWETLGIAVRKDRATKLLEKDDEQLTLEHVHSLLDGIAVQARKFIERNVK